MVFLRYVKVDKPWAKGQHKVSQVTFIRYWLKFKNLSQSSWEMFNKYFTELKT